VRTAFSARSSLGQVAPLARGGEAQQGRYLPASCRGEVLLAFAPTEPEAGIDPRARRMTYRRDGDRFRLAGTKYLISNGGIADRVVAFARPEGAPDASAPSWSRPAAPASGPSSWSRRSATRRPTRRSSSWTTTRSRPTTCWGPRGTGCDWALATLVSGRLSVAAGCLGVIEDCLAEAVTYAKGRQQHGKPIARHQLV
jgi:alkylation response protein AidB-like acyl-CoA dehydrogenase